MVTLGLSGWLEMGWVGIWRLFFPISELPKHAKTRRRIHCRARWACAYLSFIQCWYRVGNCTSWRESLGDDARDAVMLRVDAMPDRMTWAMHLRAVGSGIDEAELFGWGVVVVAVSR